MSTAAQPSWVSGWAQRRTALVALLVSCAAAPLAAAGTPDKPAAAQVLDRFRQSIWAEPVYAEIILREMPRRGEERVYRGRFWGGRTESGPATRLEIDLGGGGFTHRFLVLGGPEPEVWVSDDGSPGKPGDGVLLQPLAPALDMTAFDVLPMPYLFWMDAQLVSVERIRGRPADTYAFTPSADFEASHPAVRSVRAYLDTQYDALVQSEVIGPDGRVARTLSLLELKKVGGRWIPKDVDVRNEATRDKTRLSLTSVAVGAALGPEAFDPARLGEVLQPPARTEPVP